MGYAIVQALKSFPNMNSHFAEIDGKPNVVSPRTNLGLAIDLPGKDGNRSLVVAAIKECGQELPRVLDRLRGNHPARREGALTAEDFSGVTISLTNPGRSAPSTRCPSDAGQGAIIGAGAMEYPAEFKAPPTSRSPNSVSAS